MTTIVAAAAAALAVAETTNSSYTGGCRMTLVLWMTSYFMTSWNIYEWMLQSNDVIGTFMNECVNSYAAIKI